MLVEKNLVKARRLISERRYVKAAELILPILIDAKLLNENKLAKQQAANIFINVLAYEEVLQFLKNLLSKSDNPAPAFVYLANFVRDNGSLQAAIRLYKIAWNYGLNIEIGVTYLSALEAYNDKIAALDLGMEILQKSSNSTIAGIGSAQVLAAILSPDQEVIKIDSNLSIIQDIVSPYTQEQLAMIDLYFHLVKLLFCLKKLSQTAQLVKILQLIRKNGGNLHLTYIRNSNSYFGFIEKLLEVGDYSSNANLPEIYALGDSHCLSMAGRKINYQNQPHIINSMLATGCKIWHLRQEGSFFPKENFWNLAKTLPEGAILIAVLGEIDCREGILMAVQKGLYSTLEQAMEALIKIYFTVLVQLLEQQKLAKIYIHPVSLVLNETRFMVKIFNQLLKEFFNQLEAKYQNRLIWIDIADEFLDENDNLKAIYKLDGTHLNPLYLNLVEKFL